MTTLTPNEERICALCHQPGGWTFRDYGDGQAHTDCINNLGADYRPYLEQLQNAEKQMYTLGYRFRDSCGRMASAEYHNSTVRRYHIWGYGFHFGSWSVFQQWLADAWAYFDYCTNDEDLADPEEWE